jgi:hypothetical protein
MGLGERRKIPDAGSSLLQVRDLDRMRSVRSPLGFNPKGAFETDIPGLGGGGGSDFQQEEAGEPRPMLTVRDLGEAARRLQHLHNVQSGCHKCNSSELVAGHVPVAQNRVNFRDQSSLASFMHVNRNHGAK